jgi:NADPH:quinone reductase-like Zn-dependent oxidoreductase
LQNLGRLAPRDCGPATGSSNVIARSAATTCPP